MAEPIRVVEKTTDEGEDLSSSTPLHLAEDEVHVWNVALKAAPDMIQQFYGYLSTQESIRADRLASGELRDRYVAAHGIVRVLLAEYCGISPEALDIQDSQLGKPMLVFPKTIRAHLTFSLSHSADRALIAIADGRDIGIDLERRRDVDATALAKRFFTKAEHRAIANLPSDRQQSEFFRYWVVKEAILKGQGVGLRSLDRCELEFVFAGEQACTRTGTDSQQPKWSARILPCGHGWEGAVASMGSDWRVMYFHRMGRISHWPT